MNLYVTLKEIVFTVKVKIHNDSHPLIYLDLSTGKLLLVHTVVQSFEKMSDLNSQELVLVDGSGYIFRAYYALPPMYRSDGLPVNATFGFVICY